MALEPLDEAMARELITRVTGATAVALEPFEFGWVAEEIMSQADVEAGMNVGQPCFLIDRTGVVTLHPSLPTSMVVAEYSEARRTGQITGRQIWPETGPSTRPE